jgi:Uma2 family endonuclease
MSSLVIEPMQIPTYLDFPESIRFSRENFVEICQRNPDRHLEQEANGDITIRAPSGSETGRRNACATAALVNWAENHGGVVLDSSAGFRLPNGATRAPDAAWISDEKWQAVPPEEREGFAALTPDFVIEIVSPADTLSKQIAKMEEYAVNGVSLGWLIIPKSKEVRIFRPEAPTPECVCEADSIVADDMVLPGFVLDLRRIW